MHHENDDDKLQKIILCNEFGVFEMHASIIKAPAGFYSLLFFHMYSSCVRSALFQHFRHTPFYILYSGHLSQMTCFSDWVCMQESTAIHLNKDTIDKWS